MTISMSMNENVTTRADLDARIVRYGSLVPCKTAFIDAHTPGSDQKENFSIIGVGVSESADQHVHIKDTPGFNIGAAGQPPNCRNSLHSHSTAEVFFVLSGRWRFFWGRFGDAGAVVLDEGDIINIPTGIFRGFENIGTDYGMIMAILGGDDAGGGVTWAPEVILEAASHGLVLGANGSLYDTKKDQQLPDSVSAMPVLSDSELSQYPELSSQQIVPRSVARYEDLMALSDREAVKVIGSNAILEDRPGFEVDFLSASSSVEKPYRTPEHEVLMIMRGHWRIIVNDIPTILAPGDVMAVPPDCMRSIAPSMTGEASVYRVRGTDDPAGPTKWLTELMA